MSYDEHYNGTIADNKIECPVCLTPTIKKKPYGVCCSMTCAMEFYEQEDAVPNFNNLEEPHDWLDDAIKWVHFKASSISSCCSKIFL